MGGWRGMEAGADAIQWEAGATGALGAEGAWGGREAGAEGRLTQVNSDPVTGKVFSAPELK